MNDNQTIIQENDHLRAINQMLIQIAKAVNNSSNLDELYLSIYHSLRMITQVNNFYIVLYDPITDLMEFVFHEDEIEDEQDVKDFEKVGLKHSKSLTAELIRKGHALVLNRQEIVDRIEKDEDKLIGAPAEKWVGVPLKISGQVLGAMVTQTYTDPDLLDQRNVDILTAASEHIAIAIERKQFEASLRISDETTHTLFQVSNAVNRAENLDELFQSIHSTLSQIINLSNFFIALYDDKANQISFPFHLDRYDNLDGITIDYRSTSALTNLVFESRKPVFLKKDELLKRAQKGNISGTTPLVWVGVPLVIREKIIGVMVTQSYSDENRFTLKDADILNSVSEQIAIAIDRKQAEEALLKSQEQLKLLSRQTEQYSLAAASVISMKDEGNIYTNICQAVTKYSDFTRVMIFLFDGDPPVHQVVSSDNVEPELIDRIQAFNLNTEFYRNLYKKGVQLGQFSIYVPQILMSPKDKTPFETRILDYKRLPDTWQRHDKLLVRMNDEKDDLIGLIAVDRPKSGQIPSDETVRPLEIFSSLISQIMRYKKTQEELEIEKKKAEAASKAKSDFLANMSHEIRTPMNAIIGMTQILMDMSLTPGQLETVQIVQKSSDALLQVINDVLDFSKIEAGKLELESLEFSLRNTIEDIADLFGTKADEKNLEFFCMVSPDIPQWVKGDAGRVRQIVLNLVGNAMKFTAEGEIYLSVLPESVTENQIVVKFEVKDTGIGISKDKLNTIFESFSQADTSTTRKFGGTGLGLTISKNLVTLMKGTIGVESVEDKGSVFWFTIPLHRCHKAELTSSRHQMDFNSDKVLVADGHPHSRELICLHLKSWGCRYAFVDNIEDGLIALERAKNENTPFNRVIVHHLLPFFNGQSFGHQIRKKTAFDAAKLILLTSKGAPGDAAAIKSIGFNAYLTKPLKYSQLLNCLTEMTNQEDKPNPKTEGRDIITRHSLKEISPEDSRLLVVEDNIVNQKVISKILQKFGYDPQIATNGKDALTMLSRQHFDIVLMDVQMPEMDGLTATREIRANKGEVLNPDIPIIAMTAHAMAGDREICIAAGMNDYMTKPINPEILLEKISKYLINRIQ